MSRSYWLSIFAIVGLILWSEPPRAQGVPAPSPTPKEQAEQPANKAAKNPEGIPVIIIETLEQAKATEEREKASRDHEAKDLDAQIRAANAGERAATAGERQVEPAWLSAILSFIGTLLILCTLILTRKANEIAKDTAKRQLRAYLISNGGQIERIPEGFLLTVTIKNSGQTPAFDVKHSSESFGGDYPDGGPPEMPAVNDTHYTVIGANGDFVCAQRLFADDPEDALKNVMDGKLGFWIHGRIEYRDCFGDSHVTKFRQVYGGRIAKVGLGLHGDKHGNEAD
jgi:hypothetical protein